MQMSRIYGYRATGAGCAGGGDLRTISQTQMSRIYGYRAAGAGFSVAVISEPSIEGKCLESMVIEPLWPDVLVTSISDASVPRIPS